FTSHGHVVIDARIAEGEDQAKPALVIEIRDTGPGIPADKLDLVFEPFSQIDASAARVHGGTGLGLALARRLAEALGGELTLVAGTAGPGCRFRFIRPYTEQETRIAPPAAAPQPKTGEQMRLRGLRVLLMEDRDDIQALFTYI